MKEVIIDITPVLENKKVQESCLETYCHVYMSGHSYRNSPYETDSTCGNCDGARCNSCEERKEIFVEFINKFGDNSLLNAVTDIIEKYYEENCKYNTIRKSHELMAKTLLWSGFYTNYDTSEYFPDEHNDIKIKLRLPSEYDIKKNFPDLYTECIKEVYLVKINDNIMFKFSNEEAARQYMEGEFEILKKILSNKEIKIDDTKYNEKLIPRLVSYIQIGNEVTYRLVKDFNGNNLGISFSDEGE